MRRMPEIVIFEKMINCPLILTQYGTNELMERILSIIKSWVAKRLKPVCQVWSIDNACLLRRNGTSNFGSAEKDWLVMPALGHGGTCLPSLSSPVVSLFIGGRRLQQVSGKE